MPRGIGSVLTDDGRRALASVRTSTARLERARADREASIYAAVAAGIPVVAIAHAAGLTRERVYQLIREEPYRTAKAQR